MCAQAYEPPDADANTEATVVVHVRDVNEPPEFLRSHYSVSVSEGAKSGVLLYSDIEALDRDEVLISFCIGVKCCILSLYRVQTLM